MMKGAALLVLAVVGASAVENMNGEYKVMHGDEMISMPPFSEQLGGRNEYFDVYSPEIKTLYGQVYWTMMEGTPLPPEIVARFKNKTMAVVGYECNQVGRDAETGEEYSIPINAAYNHHHGAMLKSTNAVLKQVPAPPGHAGHVDGNGMVWVAEDQRAPAERTGPASTTFHEGNGGEFRKSYHGYSRGHAQLVESPASFHLQPMQIDTWNRSNVDAKGRPSHKFVPGIQPRNSAQLNPNAAYSGLLECPCTDRISKATDASTSAKSAGACAANARITTAAQCHASAVSHLGAWGFGGALGHIKIRTGSDASMPAGCSVTVSSSSNGAKPPAERPTVATAFFNTATSQTAKCGGGTQAATRMFGAVKGNRPEQPVGVWLEANETHLEVTITGPSSVWFGVGINASVMGAEPWTLVVEGTGAISEHKLGNHVAGKVLPHTVTVLATRIGGGRRTVVVSRPISHFDFDFEALKEKGELPIISAVGSGSKFAYHKQKSVATTNMMALDAPTCLCTEPNTAAFGGGKGQLIYTPVPDEPGGRNSTVPGAPATSLGFAKRCLPYPSSTMLLEKNPSCDLRAYTGGQSCCHHMFTLLDKDQKTPWQDKFLTYRMKWRFWFKEQIPEEPFVDIEQFNWGGMASPTEYDVPKCEAGKFGCEKGEDGHWTHTMNGTWTVADMHPQRSRTGEPQIANASGVKFLSIHGHCHAPTCITFELFNADTGEKICSQRPMYGNGNASEDFQEDGYINIAPCVFGPTEDGLVAPPGGEKGLSMSTRLFSKKVCHADYAHHGEMSLWQSYGVLVA